MILLKLKIGSINFNTSLIVLIMYLNSFFLGLFMTECKNYF